MVLKGSNVMEWCQIGDRRWVSDCGCRVVRDEHSGWWIVRNHTGSRISEARFTTLEQAKACVEQYIAQRTDAGLYPYNR